MLLIYRLVYLILTDTLTDTRPSEKSTTLKKNEKKLSNPDVICDDPLLESLLLSVTTAPSEHKPRERRRARNTDRKSCEFQSNDSCYDWDTVAMFDCSARLVTLSVWVWASCVGILSKCFAHSCSYVARVSKHFLNLLYGFIYIFFLSDFCISIYFSTWLFRSR